MPTSFFSKVAIGLPHHAHKAYGIGICRCQLYSFVQQAVLMTNASHMDVEIHAAQLSNELLQR